MEIKVVCIYKNIAAPNSGIGSGFSIEGVISVARTIIYASCFAGRFTSDRIGGSPVDTRVVNYNTASDSLVFICAARFIFVTSSANSIVSLVVGSGVCVFFRFFVCVKI